MQQEAKSTRRKRLELLDMIFLVILTLLALAIVIPFLNVLAISFATQQEYLRSSVLLVPMEIDPGKLQSLVPGRPDLDRLSDNTAVPFIRCAAQHVFVHQHGLRTEPAGFSVQTIFCLLRRAHDAF